MHKDWSGCSGEYSIPCGLQLRRWGTPSLQEPNWCLERDLHDRRGSYPLAWVDEQEALFLLELSVDEVAEYAATLSRK